MCLTVLKLIRHCIAKLSVFSDNLVTLPTPISQQSVPTLLNYRHRVMNMNVSLKGWKSNENGRNQEVTRNTIALKARRGRKQTTTHNACY